MQRKRSRLQSTEFETSPGSGVLHAGGYDYTYAIIVSTYRKDDNSIDGHVGGAMGWMDGYLRVILTVYY